MNKSKIATRYLAYSLAFIVFVVVASLCSWSVFQYFTESNQTITEPDSEIRSTNFAQELLNFDANDPARLEDYYRPIPEPSGVFSVSENLREEVDFWKRIYSSVYSFQALVHDNRDLGIVYGVVDLRDEPGVDRDNFDSVRRAARTVFKRYRDNIEFLVKGRYQPEKLTGERRRLYLYINARGGVAKFKDAHTRVRLQRGLRDTFAKSIIRSGNYLEEYRRIFKEKGLPEELTLLPHIESSFVSRAYSHAGAVGIWQLTRVASYRLINVSSSVDERIDPWRSAEAAATILKYNYRKLGSWPLAVTAYNQGLGAMRRAVRQLGTKDIRSVIEKYRSRSFGFAGRNFYCAFVATLEIVHDYEKYYGKLEIDKPLPVNRHALKASKPFLTIAKELGVDEHKLAQVNPHIRSSGRSGRAKIPRGTNINIPAEELTEEN